MATFITISVGNNGSILTLNKGRKTVKMMYISDLTTEKNWGEVENLLKRFQRTPIYIILDNVGQNYIKRSFFNMNYFDLKKIVERKFNYEIPKNDLKKKRSLGKNPVTKEQEYMFISSPIDDFLQDWLNMISSKNNILQGIYMLPLEVENILKRINKKQSSKKQKPVDWNIFLFENKISGFREITFYKGRLLFTRILSLDSEDKSDFVKNFEDNKLRTIEYLKRFSQSFEDTEIRIFTVSSDEKKELLSQLTDKRIQPYSLLEFGNLLGEKNAKNYQQDYCDILLQRLIMRNRRILLFSNAEIRNIRSFSTVLNFLSAIRTILILVLIVFFSVSMFSSNRLKSTLQQTQNTYEQEHTNLEKRKKEEFGDRVDNIEEIMAVAFFYDSLENTKTDPFEFIKKFSENSYDTVLVNELSWNKNAYMEHIFRNKYKHVFSIVGVLINKSGKVEDLFKIYEEYNIKIRAIFGNYAINITKLPENIDFNTKYYYFPLKMNFIER
ncbi:MAG: hypothetical protein LBG48_04760 [Rickettsiales bacterium]|jgi:hypothetical protein|nr:hypothetical protein [Rickettsiales bacterium]